MADYVFRLDDGEWSIPDDVEIEWDEATMTLTARRIPPGDHRVSAKVANA